MEVETDHAGYTGQPPALAKVSVVSFWLLMPVAIAGALTQAARRMPLFLWMIPPSLLLSVMLLAAFTRYRVPADAVFVMLAALALVAPWRWATGPRGWRPSGLGDSGVLSSRR